MVLRRRVLSRRYPLNVLLLITDLAYGGTPRVVQRLALGLSSRGHCVRVACLMSRGGVGEELQAAGIPVVWLRANHVGAMGASWQLLNLLRERVDVLHAFLFHSNLAGRALARMAGVPAVIVSERSVESTKARWRVWADRLTWRLADVWTANSAEVARVLHTREGIAAHRIETIRNGIDVAHFSASCDGQAFRHEMGIGPDARVVLCVGRLDALKGQRTLLDAFQAVAVHEPRAQLCLLGDGSLKDTLVCETQRMALTRRVCFAGVRGDVRQAFAAAELLVLPSTEEGLPGVVLEAQAAGLPVVATAVGGTPELVADGRTGLLVPPERPTELAAAMLRLLNNEQLRVELASAARRSAAEFSTDRMVDATERLYVRILRGPARTSGVEAA